MNREAREKVRGVRTFFLSSVIIRSDFDQESSNEGKKSMDIRLDRVNIV